MNDTIRSHFPSLKRIEAERPVVYLDGPAGTQVPNSVMEAITQYYKFSNANRHGCFQSSIETDKILQETRGKIATFLGAENSKCISLGQNMTTLAYSLCQGFKRRLNPGNEIVITQLDHEANRGPWLSLKEKNIVVKEVKLKQNGTLDYDDFKSKIGNKTKLVAMGWASNIFGTVNNVRLVRQWTKEVNALLLIDAVHYAPHFPINVPEEDFDFLLCSAYKFYGPHIGILYSKNGLLNEFETDRLRTQEQEAPYRIETGTLNHAAIAGVQAAIDFIGSHGQGDSLQEKFDDAYLHISEHEGRLAQLLYTGLNEIPHVQVYGPDFNTSLRAPTIAFTHKEKSPVDVCKYLASKGIYAWAGHFYAIRAVEALGLDRVGGVTRMGVCMYNTEEEVEYVVSEMKKL